MLAFQMASYVPSVRMHFAMSSFVVHPPGTFSRYIIKPLGCRSRAMFRGLCRSVYLTCAFQVLFLLHSSSLSLFNKYCNYSAGGPRGLNSYQVFHPHGVVKEHILYNSFSFKNVSSHKHRYSHSTFTG